jgi:putative nucleotidyltransferase with HDIG domain
VLVHKQAAGYGRGEVAIEDDAGDLLLGADELIEIIDAPSYQPPVLPAIALEALALSRAPDLDLRQVQRLLERDPMLAARMLRVAQSPAYATRVPVASLGDALRRLGVEAMTRIVLEVSMGATVFRVRGYEGAVDTVRRHSTATAYIARAVAHAARLPTELAFLCGLLHDVGVVACLLVFARPRPGGAVPAFELVWPVVEPLHQGVSARLASLWKLPEEVGRVIGHHHVRPGAPGRNPIAGAVMVADAIACELGVGSEVPPEPAVVQAVREEIGFPDKALAELMTYAQGVVAQIE